MRRTTILIDEALDSDMRALASRLHKPLGGLVREAIARYVEAHAAATGSGLGFVGIGSSGRSDVAERHEELLFEGTASEPAVPKAVRAPAMRRATRKASRS